MFKYIRRIKEEGISEKLWTENKKIDELKFKFQEKQDPASYARYHPSPCPFPPFLTSNLLCSFEHS